MAPKLYLFYGSPAVGAVLVTAKALGLALEEKELDYENNEHLSPEYLKLNPQHTVPTLDDNGNIIHDSHAINCYLVGKYGKDDSLYPKDLYKHALVDQRLAFDLGTLFPILRTVDLAYMKKEIKSLPEKWLQEIKNAYEILEKFLEGKLWIAVDQVTIADLSCITTVSCLDYHLPIDPKVYPNTAAWMKRVHALPCCANDRQGLNTFRGFFDALKA